MTPSLGIEPGPQWWEANALTTAPSLHAKANLETLETLILVESSVNVTHALSEL